MIPLTSSKRTLKHGVKTPSGAWLCESELEVAKLVALGKSRKEVAAIRGVGKRTVCLQVQNIFEKLNVHDAVTLTHFVLNRGLIKNIFTLLLALCCVAGSINPLSKPAMLSPKATEAAKLSGVKMAVIPPPQDDTWRVTASWESPANGVRVYVGTNNGNYFTNFYAPAGTNISFALKWPWDFSMNVRAQSTNGGLVSAMTTNLVYPAPIPPITNVVLSAASAIGQVWLSRTFPPRWTAFTNVPGASVIIAVSRGPGMWLFGAGVPLTIKPQ